MGEELQTAILNCQAEQGPVFMSVETELLLKITLLGSWILTTPQYLAVPGEYKKDYLAVQEQTASGGDEPPPNLICQTLLCV